MLTWKYTFVLSDLFLLYTCCIHTCQQGSKRLQTLNFENREFDLYELLYIITNAKLAPVYLFIDQIISIAVPSTVYGDALC